MFARSHLHALGMHFGDVRGGRVYCGQKFKTEWQGLGFNQQMVSGLVLGRGDQQVWGTSNLMWKGVAVMKPGNM